MKRTPRTTAYLLETYLRDQKMKRYQRDPEAWLIERFGEDPRSLRWSLWPGYEEHQWDGTPDPFYQMFQSLADGKWIGMESGTSTGKTYMLPRAIYWFLDCFPNSLVVTTAPKQQQLKAVLWSEVQKCFHKFKRIRPKAEMFSLRVLPEGRSRASAFTGQGEDELTDMWMAIGVVSGVGANEESATKMQGYHREHMLIVVEEAAGVPLPVFTAIKNTSTGANNLVIAVGNPDASTDALHQFCVLAHVDHIRVSSYDHPNVVLGKAHIPGAVTQESIDRRRDEYGEESNLYKSRVRGIAPEQSADALIRMEWLRAVCPILDGASANDVQQVVPDAYDSRNALGVDVANSENGDMAALAWGRLNHLTQLQEFQCPNANDLAYNVTREDSWLQEHKKQQYHTPKVYEQEIEPDAIGVDAVGVGVATVNTFLAESYEVKSLHGGANKDVIPTDAQDKPLYMYNSLRSQMYHTFALELAKKEFDILINDKRMANALAKELVTVKMEMTSGSITIESKQKIKKRLGKSPNLADVAVYWNWMRKVREPNYEMLPIG